MGIVPESLGRCGLKGLFLGTRVVIAENQKNLGVFCMQRLTLFHECWNEVFLEEVGFIRMHGNGGTRGSRQKISAKEHNVGMLLCDCAEKLLVLVGMAVQIRGEEANRQDLAFEFRLVR